MKTRGPARTKRSGADRTGGRAADPGVLNSAATERAGPVRKYAPPAILINRSAEIVQVRGLPTPYLEFPPGQANVNLFQAVAPRILSELRQLIDSAFKDNKPTRGDGLTLEKDGERHSFCIRVVPLRLDGSNDQRYLSIFFEDIPKLKEYVASPNIRGK